MCAITTSAFVAVEVANTGTAPAFEPARDIPPQELFPSAPFLDNRRETP